MAFMARYCRLPDQHQSNVYTPGVHFHRASGFMNLSRAFRETEQKEITCRNALCGTLIAVMPSYCETSAGLSMGDGFQQVHSLAVTSASSTSLCASLVRRNARKRDLFMQSSTTLHEKYWIGQHTGPINQVITTAFRTGTCLYMFMASVYVDEQTLQMYACVPMQNVRPIDLHLDTQKYVCNLRGVLIRSRFADFCGRAGGSDGCGALTVRRLAEGLKSNIELPRCRALKSRRSQGSPRGLKKRSAR